MTRRARSVITVLAATGTAVALLTAAPASGQPAPAAERSADVVTRAGSGAKAKLKDVRVRFRRVARGLDEPTDVESARDGTGRLFVTERTGTVRVVRKGRVVKRPYLDLGPRVSTGGGEQGLLGIAFRPGFRKHREVYVSYTAASGALRVSRFTVPDHRRDRVARKTEQVVLTVPHPGATNHNGGGLAFGTDGELFVSTGDGGSGGDPSNNAQDLGSLLGKILRIDVTRSCGAQAYCVPRDNPFVGRPGARGEVWALGLRNPWRIARDHVTGDLWIGDVGQNRYEEVDRLPTRARGANFGWSCREGRKTYDATRCAPGTSYRAPVYVYPQAKGRSVIGGHVYRGKRYSRLLGGRYLFTDFFSGTLWLHAPGSGRTRVVGSMPSGVMVTAFGEAGKREIVAVSYDGSLWRMRARRR